jgi:hypothetical protein
MLREVPNLGWEDNQQVRAEGRASSVLPEESPRIEGRVRDSLREPLHPLHKGHHKALGKDVVCFVSFLLIQYHHIIIILLTQALNELKASLLTFHMSRGHANVLNGDDFRCKIVLPRKHKSRKQNNTLR